MSETRVTEVPENNHISMQKLKICLRITEEKQTGQTYDEKRDETHTTVRKIDENTKYVTCPSTEISHMETSEQMDDEEANRIDTKVGFDDVTRTDFDTVEFVVDGETYVVTYDMSPLDKYEF